MTAKVLYTKQGNDPTTITWPLSGPPYEQFKLVSGTPLVISGLIGYGDGSITFPDGRLFPALTAAGSSFVHQKA